MARDEGRGVRDEGRGVRGEGRGARDEGAVRVDLRVLCPGRRLSQGHQAPHHRQRQQSPPRSTLCPFRGELILAHLPPRPTFCDYPIHPAKTSHFANQHTCRFQRGGEVLTLRRGAREAGNMSWKGPLGRTSCKNTGQTSMMKIKLPRARSHQRDQVQVDGFQSVSCPSISTGSRNDCTACVTSSSVTQGS